MIYTIQPMVELRTDRSGDLLLKARSRDEEALNPLLARDLPRLRARAGERLPRGLRTMSDPEDLVQVGW